MPAKDEDVREHVVPDSARGERLDQHLPRVFADLSRSRVQALVESGAVTLGQRPAKASQRLRGGEHVRLCIPPPAPVEAKPEALLLQVLFEDAHLLVLDKTAGMVVHPGAGHLGGTVVNALLHRVKDLKGVGGELRPGIVHRLDKETSGCLVVAKSQASLAGLVRAFKAREVDKTYLALVHGAPKQGAAIETLYGRHPVHRQRFTGKVREGKPARTSYEVKERFQDASLLEVRLHTGRTHQIRVHLAESGYPLLGDSTYGSRKKRSPPVAAAEEALGRQALHAWRLSFPHPVTQKRVSCEAPLPVDFSRALAIFRNRGTGYVSTF